MGGFSGQRFHRLPTVRTTRGALFGAAVGLAAMPASAQPAETDRRTVAEALFEQGKALQASGDFAHGCPKLEEVTRLLPGKIGALLQLAECFEGAGKTASARTAYEGAERAAVAASDPRAEQARGKIRELTPRVPRLTVVVPAVMRAWKDLKIQRDELEVGPGQWGAAIPLDPGVHTVSASASGKARWRQEIKVEVGGVGSVEVPLLVDVGAAAAAPSAPPAAAPVHARGTPSWVWVTGGAGVALLGVAAGFGVDGLMARKTIEAHCGSDYSRPCRETTAVYDFTDDVQRKNRGLGVFVGAGGLGAIALGVAVAGLVSSGKERKASAGRMEVVPVVSGSGGGWVIQGGF